MRKTSAALVLGAAATAALVAHGLSLHPQGDITRIEPHLIVTLAIWSLLFGLTLGRRAGAIAALVSTTIVMLVIAGYIFFIRPIDYAECQVPAEELSDASGRAHGSLGVVVVTPATA